MGVINDNNGPLQAESSIVPLNQLSLLEDILFQLKVVTFVLEQAFNISDTESAIRNSITVNDLQNIK